MHHTHMHHNFCIIQMTPKLCLKPWGRLNSCEVRVHQRTNDFRYTPREGHLFCSQRPLIALSVKSRICLIRLKRKIKNDIVCDWQTMSTKKTTVQTASSLDVPSGHELHGDFGTVDTTTAPRMSGSGATCNYYKILFFKCVHLP